MDCTSAVSKNQPWLGWKTIGMCRLSRPRPTTAIGRHSHQARGGRTFIITHAVSGTNIIDRLMINAPSPSDAVVETE